MIPADPILGTFYHGVGAMSSSACYTPQKKVRGWSWQTYWLAQASVCWFLLPILGAMATIPHLGTVLAEAPQSAMINSFLLGMAYGIGGTAFGVSIRYIGYSLTYAIAVGLSSVLGTIIPPLVAGTLGAAFQKTGGGYIFLGIAIGTLGIAVSGAAGRVKELGLRGVKAGPQDSSLAPVESDFNIGKGLALSLVAGVLSAVYGFSLNAGQPIADVAARHGADVWQGNVIYIFSNSGAFVTTSIYCLYLHFKHKTLGEFRSLPESDRTARLPLNFAFATLTGVLWYGQFFFYNLGHVRMGEYKFSSWALHMTMLVLFSGLIALIFKEWSGSRLQARLLFGLSMLLLIAGVAALTYGNYVGQTVSLRRVVSPPVFVGQAGSLRTEWYSVQSTAGRPGVSIPHSLHPTFEVTSVYRTGGLPVRRRLPACPTRSTDVPIRENYAALGAAARLPVQHSYEAG